MGRVIPFVACVLVSTIASATVLVPAEFGEIVSGSEIIAHARVIDVRPEWADGRRWIDTVVTAEVVSYLKGGSRETLSFKVPGGQLGRYRSVVVGAPTFVKGDEAVLFLRDRGGDELPDVFGLNQGVFRIRYDARTGQRVVVPPPVMKADARPDPQPVKRGALDRQPLAFEAFGARVRDVMSSATGAPRRAPAAGPKGSPKDAR
jgi:hypothetical protein